ncbi:hypothetical protein FBULB1_2179 [Fusarium bulbicola]|nr:hypothetical protein FBULB1_2179 [Fusarium bulbicola]
MRSSHPSSNIYVPRLTLTTQQVLGFLQVQVRANWHHREGLHSSEFERVRGAAEDSGYEARCAQVLGLLEDVLCGLESGRSMRRAAGGHLEVELDVELAVVLAGRHASILDRGLVQD